MNLLLDTHVFLWMETAPWELSTAATEALSDPDNSLLISVAGVWEAQIKASLGKLPLSRPLKAILRDHCSQLGIAVLPVAPGDVFALDRLPDHHRDPFDRLLVATALARDLILVTADPQIARYPVATLW
ncbi:MAG: type II toxin-antitoxin system VapC family toxin [Planctomycetaceae bacterium]